MEARQALLRRAEGAADPALDSAPPVFDFVLVNGTPPASRLTRPRPLLSLITPTLIRRVLTLCVSGMKLAKPDQSYGCIWHALTGVTVPAPPYYPNNPNNPIITLITTLLSVRPAPFRSSVARELPPSRALGLG